MALNDVPLTGQTLAVTREPIRQNFLSINSVFDINHIAFNGGANQGKHDFIELPSAIPTTATVASEVALYSKVGVGSGIPELFFQRANLPANSGYSITEALAANDGWTRLPSGILLRWRSNIIANVGLSGLITFAIGGFPGFTQPPFAIFIQTVAAGTDPNSFVYLSSNTLTAASFRVFSTQRTVVSGIPAPNAIYNYFAIGM